MEALKTLVADKRKAIEDDNGSSQRPAKYLRRGEIERLKEEAKAREEEERMEREEAARLEAEAKNAVAAKPTIVSFLPSRLSQILILKVRGEQGPSRSITKSPLPSGSNSPLPDSTFNISEKETIRRLRAKGQPIRLFAESDKDRRLRLRALELIEEKGSERQGGQNDFKKALEDVENVERELQNKNNKGKKRGEAEQASTGVLDLGLVKSDPDKLYPLIYYALKRTLKEWEEAMDERPGWIIIWTRQPAKADEYTRTHQTHHTGQASGSDSGTVGGISETTVQNSSSESGSYLQFSSYLILSDLSCATQSLPSDMLARMAEVVHHMQKRQYQRANDSYLRLSIGNAPWPIGVTMVGYVLFLIHATFWEFLIGLPTPQHPRTFGPGEDFC